MIHIVIMSSTRSPTVIPGINSDPKTNSPTIRKAFLAEAIANLSMVPLVTNTSWVLSLILNHPSDVSPSSILFARLFGATIIGVLTTALLTGYRNTRSGIESRRSTYLMLGIGETMLIPILVNEMLKDSVSQAAVSKKVAEIGTGVLILLLVWRLYILIMRPDLLGRYREKGVVRI